MILAILQARMSSTRLPGKVLKPILGRPMLALQLERLARASRIDRLVIATSTEASDDPIADFCTAEGHLCHRGSLTDVLGRFWSAYVAHGPADHVVRLTADCPLADPAIVDACIALHLESGADYTSNGLVRTYPDGLDVEVMTADMLRRANAEAPPGPSREHVTMHIYQNPDRFRIVHLTQPRDLGELRWTVDTPADLAMVTAVFAALLPTKPEFLQDDVLALLAARPDIAALNAPA